VTLKSETPKNHPTRLFPIKFEGLLLTYEYGAPNDEVAINREVSSRERSI
jgi:hypothetical protein